MKLLFNTLLFLFVISGTGWGQNLPSPQAVNASDGIYPDQIIITWQAADKNSFYKVYRSNACEDGQAALISNGWKRSTYLVDRNNLQLDKLYYYQIQSAKNSQTVSTLSPCEAGYISLKKDLPIANPNKDSLSLPSIDTDSTDINGLLMGIDTDTIYKDTLELFYLLDDIFLEQYTRIQFRFYLSEDAELDRGDSLIKSLWSAPERVVGEMKSLLLKLPKKVSNGSYYMIMTAAPDGRSKEGIQTKQLFFVRR